MSDEDFGRLVSEGRISPATLVWKEGMAQWQPYAQIAAAENATGDTAICAVSGRRYPKAQMVQFESQWVSAEHRDEFFQRLREGIGAHADQSAVPGPYGYAGFWIRFLARIIDGIITGVASWIILIPAIAIFGMANASSSHPASTMAMLVFQVIVQGSSIAIAIAYEGIMLRKYDATLGKMALGIKILRTDGAKLSWGRIVGRYFSQWISMIILFIGYIMAGVDDEKRALHDRICDTRVIKARP